MKHELGAFDTVVKKNAATGVLCEDDLAQCYAKIKTGSFSFHAASRLLPAQIRDPAMVLYAFCRMADDAVDLRDDKAASVLQLRDRLDQVYAGRPQNRAIDRAFAAVVEHHEMPKALPSALLEGLAWDAMERRYDDLDALVAYCARVASAVGAMMCVLMNVRDPHALARACDLGVAMQLTNIARDIGEDARARRIYLPLDWMDQAGLSPEGFFADPLPLPGIRDMAKRLLREADRLYHRSEAGISALPFSARPGIYAARHIYAGIGAAIRSNGYDSVSWRGRTSKSQKARWLGLASLRAGLSLIAPQSPVLYAPVLPQCAFLVDAAAQNATQEAPWGDGRAGALLSIFAELEARDRGGIQAG